MASWFTRVKRKRECRNNQLYPSGGFAATSPILGEELQDNGIQQNNFDPQTLPLR